MGKGRKILKTKRSVNVNSVHIETNSISKKRPDQKMRIISYEINKPATTQDSTFFTLKNILFKFISQ